MGEAPKSPSEAVFRVMQPVYQSRMFSRVGIRVIFILTFILLTVHFVSRTFKNRRPPY